MPLALTDAQLSAVLAAAQPLDVADRDPFLQAVAAALSNRPALGDGDVHRACREAQRRFFDPPLETARAPRSCAGPGALGKRGASPHR